MKYLGFFQRECDGGFVSAYKQTKDMKYMKKTQMIQTCMTHIDAVVCLILSILWDLPCGEYALTKFSKHRGSKNMARLRPLNNLVVLFTALTAFFYLKTRFKMVHYAGPSFVDVFWYPTAY